PRGPHDLLPFPTRRSSDLFSSQFATPQEGNAMYGYLNSFQVFLEAAGMFCAPWLVNRVGAKNGLIFAGMVMAMRMIASGLVEGPDRKSTRLNSSHVKN